MNESNNASVAQVNVDPLVSTNPDEFIVSMQVDYKGKPYAAYFVIPPEKQNMTYVREMTSGLASAVDRKIKELLFGPK